MAARQPRRIAVASWILFDLANTAFLTGVLGLMFPLWVTRVEGGNDAVVAYTITGAMLFLLVGAPISGMLLGQARRRVPLLAAATAVAVLSTMLLGSGGLIPTLALLAVAICAFQIGQIFYLSLLPEISTRKHWGIVSGLGIGTGYLGSLIAVGMAVILLDDGQYVLAFRSLAILFAIFTLPLFLFLRERPRQVANLGVRRKTIEGMRQLSLTLGEAMKVQPLRRFLLARVCFTMAVNTAASFAVLYATRTVGLGVREVEVILLIGIAFAIPSGAIWGILADRFGPRRALMAALLGMMGTFCLSLSIPWFELPPRLWWGVGIASGVCIAGTWATDRPFMLGFIPQGREGEYLSLHSLTARVSAVLGPFLWGFLAVSMGLGQLASLTALLILLALALFILYGTETSSVKVKSGLLDVPPAVGASPPDLST